MVSRVHLTRSRSYGGKRRRLVHVHDAPIRPGQIEVLKEVPVTSLARTVLDLGRTLPFHQGVAVADRALALGLDRGELWIALLDMEHWPGVRRARRVAEFADGRSESVGESVSRVRFGELGLPAPIVQFAVVDPSGRPFARSDFGWEQQRTLGEFDGKIKYGRLLRAGQSIQDVIYAEKLREDALRDFGWQVVRWGWSELDRPELIRDRLLRAFARAGGAFSVGDLSRGSTLGEVA